MSARLRTLLLGLIALFLAALTLVLVSATTGTPGKVTVTLIIAVTSLAVSVAKTGYDVLIEPSTKVAQEAQVRQVMRDERIAEAIKPMLGYHGLPEIADVWTAAHSRDVNSCRSSCAKLHVKVKSLRDLTATAHDLSVRKAANEFYEAANEAYKECISYANAHKAWDDALSATVDKCMATSTERARLLYDWSKDYLGQTR
jgi:hypothetical protein